MTREKEIEQIIAEAVKLYRGRDRILNRPGATTALLHIDGCITGLRMALCVLAGWDVQQESGKEEKADDMIIEWWRENFPGEW